MAKYLDDNGLLYFWQKLKLAFASQSDFNTLENTVQGLSGAEANVIDTVKVNGSALTPDANKAVNVTVTEGTANGTIKVNGVDVDVHGLGSAAYTDSSAYDAAGAAANVLGSASDSASANTVYGAKAAAAAAQAAIPTNNNQLTNGAGYQTSSDVQSAINSALAGVTSISYEIVQSLPATGEAGVIYLISNSGSNPNSYDEYIWITSSGTGWFEKIGTTDVDLTNYWNTTNLTAITNAEIDTIVAA